MAARPWENRVFDTTSVSKDVFDSYSVKSADHEYNIPNSNNTEPMSNGNAIGEPPRLIKLQPSSSSSSYQNQAGTVPAASSTTQTAATMIIPSLRPENTNHGPATSSTAFGNGHSHYSPSMHPQRTSSQGAPPFHAPVTPPSAYKLSTPVLIRSASPRTSIRREDIEEGGSTVSAATARSMVSGPRYAAARYSNAGSVMSRDDESLASSPSVPNYMQATQSAKAKVRSHSTPKQRSGTPEKEWASSKTKRLSLPVAAETPQLIPNSGPIILRPFRPSPYAQRSPSLRSDQQSAPSLANDSHHGDASSEVSGVRALYR